MTQGVTSARRLILAGTVVVAFALRLALLLPQVHSDFHYLQGQLYGAWGFNAAASGRWDLVEDNIGTALTARARALGHLVDPDLLLDEGFAPVPAARGTFSYEQPGPGWVTGVAWRVTGDYRFIWPLVLQAVADSVAIVGLYAIAVRLWGALPALAAALGYALFLPQAQLSAFPLYNVWCGPLLIGIVALTAWRPTVGRRSILIHGVVAGLLAGVGTLFTPTALPMVVVPASCIACTHRVRQLLTWSVAACLGLLVCLLPWSYRNWQHHGEFRPVASATWWNLYYGLVEQDDSPFGPFGRHGWPNDEEKVAAWLRDTHGVRSWYTRESEAAIKPYVLQAFREEPEYFLQISASRFLAALTMASDTADLTPRVHATGACYRALADRAATPPAGVCDRAYATANRWPAQTAWVIDWLTTINRPFRVRIDHLWKYGHRFAEAIVIGLPMLACLGLVIGAARERLLAIGFALTVATWCAVYAINHLEARYLAGAQALLTAAGWAGVVYVISWTWRGLTRRASGGP